MEKVKEFLRDKKLCNSNFLLYMENFIEFINPDLIDFCGCYLKNEKIKAKVPKIINDYTRSIVIHELGHIYDYYVNNEIIENEDSSLMWELLYLEYSKNYELLSKRVEKIEKDITRRHNKSLQKIKRS